MSKWKQVKRNEKEGLSFSPYYYEQAIDSLVLSVDPYLNNSYGVRLTHKGITCYKEIITADDLETAKNEAVKYMNKWLKADMAKGLSYAFKYGVLKRPYTIEELQENMNENCYVTGCIAVPLSDIIDHDLEEFLDLIAMKLTGSELLMDINYNAVAVYDVDSNDTSIIIEVHGDVSEIISNEDEE